MTATKYLQGIREMVSMVSQQNYGRIKYILRYKLNFGIQRKALNHPRTESRIRSPAKCNHA